MQEQREPYRQRLIEHSHELSCQEAEDSHFPVGSNGGHFSPVWGKGKAGGVGFVLRKFIQVCVRFIFPLYVLGELEVGWEAGPVFQHPRSVSRDNDSKLGIQANLGQRRRVHLVKDMEGLVASPSVIDKDLSCRLFRNGHDGNGISGIVDPLALTWMVTSDQSENHSEHYVVATFSIGIM